MKKIIKSVLDKFSDKQPNLSSESAREKIAEEIEKALERDDNYLYEDAGDGHMLKVDEVKDSWKCEICNKSTYELDYDYIGTGTNHLSCEVRLENDMKIMKSEPSGDEVAKALGHMDEEGNYITGPEGHFKKDKDWPGLDRIQKQVYNEMTSDGLPPGGDAQAVVESHKLAKEIARGPDRRNSDRRTLWIDKLSEEVVSDNDTGYIYESPDGGETIYKRKLGEDKRELVSKEDWKQYTRNR